MNDDFEMSDENLTLIAERAMELVNTIGDDGPDLLRLLSRAILFEVGRHVAVRQRREHGFGDDVFG